MNEREKVKKAPPPTLHTCIKCGNKPDIRDYGISATLRWQVRDPRCNIQTPPMRMLHLALFAWNDFMTACISRRTEEVSKG